MRHDIGLGCMSALYAIVRPSVRLFVCLSVCLSVRHMGGSVNKSHAVATLPCEILMSENCLISEIHRINSNFRCTKLKFDEYF